MKHTTDLDYYLKFVKNLSDLESKELFHNSGPDCASIVMGEIFLKATKTLRIYSQNMNGEVTNKPYYINNLMTFLKREDSKIKLIVEDEESALSNSESFKILLGESNIDKVDIVYNKGNKPKTGRGELFHFMTGDEKMFRLELDTQNHKAQCSFNDMEFTKALNIGFDKIFDEIKNQN